MIEEKITSRQMICMIILIRLSTAISTMPTINLPPYNQDMWIMVLLSIIYTIIMMFPLMFLANKFNEFSIIGYMQIIYGKIIGKVIGFMYGLYLISYSINGTTIQSELVASTILDDASNMVIAVFMMIVCIYCVSRGIIAITRASELFAPAILIIVIILVLLGLQNVDLSILKPILADSTLKDLSIGAIRLSLFFTEIIILSMLVPELENKKDINKIFVKSVSISMIILAIVTIMSQATMGIEFTRHSNFPFLLYVRAIQQFKVLTRIDSIFVIAWLISSIVRITTYIYLSVRVFRELFNKKEKEKIILFFIGLIVGITTYIFIGYRSAVGIRKHLDLYYAILSIIFLIFIPFITCIIYFFRRKSIKKKGVFKENLN